MKEEELCQKIKDQNEFGQPDSNQDIFAVDDSSHWKGRFRSGQDILEIEFDISQCKFVIFPPVENFFSSNWYNV